MCQYAPVQLSPVRAQRVSPDFARCAWSACTVGASAHLGGVRPSLPKDPHKRGWGLLLKPIGTVRSLSPSLTSCPIFERPKANRSGVKVSGPLRSGPGASSRRSQIFEGRCWAPAGPLMMFGKSPTLYPVRSVGGLGLDVRNHSRGGVTRSRSRMFRNWQVQPAPGLTAG